MRMITKIERCFNIISTECRSFFPKQTFYLQNIGGGEVEVSPNYVYVYRNTIKDYLYSGGQRAPPPFQTQFTMYIILKGKRKICFLAHFTHLEL